MLSDEIIVTAESRRTASPFLLTAMLERCRSACDRLENEVNSQASRAANLQPLRFILQQVESKLLAWLAEEETAPQLPLLIALDGRAAAGKSTLAEELARILEVAVFHMDDFYLTPDRKTAERLAEPGGNVDRERFFSDVLEPLAAGEPFSYRPLIPHVWMMGEDRHVATTELAIVEGAYTLHPDLRPFYRPDLAFFIDVDPVEQLRRIRIRNGEAAAEVFRTKWIPLEEAYIKEAGPDLFCHHALKLGLIP